MLKTLKQLEVGDLRAPVVILVISKIKERICNLTIRLSSFPSGFLSPAHEVRGGVTTSKGMQQGHSSRCIRTKRCTDGINTVSWRCFPIAKLIQKFAEGCKDNNSLKSPIIITTYNVCVHCFCVRNWLCLLLRACRTYTAILVSASSWSHLCTDPLLEKTFSSKLIFTSFFLETENLYFFSQKRKLLFAVGSILQKHFPLWWKLVLVSPVTFRLWPAPFFSLVDSFKLCFLLFFDKLWHIFKMPWNIPPWSRWWSFQHRK